MAHRARWLLLFPLLLCITSACGAADARFDLVGPRIDVRVTRDGVTLPIASVPNLQPGDKLWVHPDLPATQSVKYLLICVFLRGTTNPPPPEWFFRIPTWDRKVREEGTFITVPAEAQQALLFLAPETGGDFSTLRSAVQGRPGAFVRASQDLIEAGFEEARIERYIADIRRVPPTDPSELQKHSALLARTLALKPNDSCFKQPVDTQFTCLTQSGSQIVLDDGHGKTIVDALNGPSSDLINQASYSQLGGGGLYSAYVGAIVDLVRILGNLHSAQYQYIPAISFPQAEAMNLRLNTPPSFHNPKSVLVIALPSVQTATPPPLRPADANHVACLLKPSVVLPIEGAPLVFSSDFAHDMVLHLNTPPGAPIQPDIPLTPDAYFGGLVLQQTPQHHVPLRDPLAESVPPALKHPELAAEAGSVSQSGSNINATPGNKAPAVEPVLLTGTIAGRWGFDAFNGPTVPIQLLPGTGWHIISGPDNNPNSTQDSADLIAGHAGHLLITSTGTACVHTITALPDGHSHELSISFQPSPAAELQPDRPHPLVLDLPLEHDLTPGDLHVSIQQYDQPKADQLATRTFSEPARVTSAELHAGDRTILLTGAHLNEIDKLTLGDLIFSPVTDDATAKSLRLALPNRVAAPSTHINDHLTAKIALNDGRVLTVPVTVSSPRPVITLLRKSEQPAPGTNIALGNAEDLPLSSRLVFTLKSPAPFPRTGQIEIETLDGTLRTVLTLAPSGGLLLQDPHTIVATLDPLRSFGPSAFGALHLRSVYPPAASTREPGVPDPDSRTRDADTFEPATAATSDWLPLVTLVREPMLTLLQCPADITQACAVTGSDLFLLQSVSADPAFANPVEVPDGFTGTTLSIPHISAATLFLKLRDDPDSIDSAILPTPPATVAHNRPAGHAPKAKGEAATPAATAPAPTSVPQQSSSASSQGPPA